MFRLRNVVRGVAVGAVVGIGVVGYEVYKLARPPLPANYAKQSLDKLHHPMQEIHNKDIPTREEMLTRLKRSSTRSAAELSAEGDNGKEEMYDILVIGGGATGAGVAMDAVSRGLKVALVERDDFASGTSSRSTKLIHGGVRYLEKAFTKADKGQLHLVQDALRERKHLINIAPHLSRPLPIIVPLYQSWPSILFYAPYFYAGVKAYDLFAGEDGVLEPSYWISYHEAREKFPMLKSEGLKGGVVYYDGQHNDSRMCLGIALTAAAKGAVLANHVEVTGITIDTTADRVVGAAVKDNMSGAQFNIRAKCVVNATGPFSDAIRYMATEGKAPPAEVLTGQPAKALPPPAPKAAAAESTAEGSSKGKDAAKQTAPVATSSASKFQQMIAPSSGVHVVLSDQYCPAGMGLIIPETSDGRVIFMLPWEGSTVVGTTDAPAPVQALPRPYEHEVQFILKEVSNYLNHEVKRADVDAAWTGIRPLAKDVHAKDTASTSRDHVIEHTRAGMVTIAGGKWTTYRKMAEDAVDAVLKQNKTLEAEAKKSAAKAKYVIDTKKIGESATLNAPLIGAAGWSLQLPTTLKRLGFDKDVAEHLAHNYGDKAFDVSRVVSREKSLNRRLASGYPFLEAEVVYAARHEYALTATDMIANRIRLAFLNSDASYHALPRVIALMARELHWDTARKVLEYQHAAHFLSTMNRKGVSPLAFSDPLKLQYTESRLREVFDSVPIQEHEISSLRAAFNALDRDEDGHLSRAELLKLVHSSELFGLKDAKVDLAALDAGKVEGLNKPTRRFLRQLDLLDKDDNISWEPFLFSVAASFHSLEERAPARKQNGDAKQHDKLAAAVPVLASVAPAVPGADSVAAVEAKGLVQQSDATTVTEPQLGSTKKPE